MFPHLPNEVFLVGKRKNPCLGGSNFFAVKHLSVVSSVKLG